MNKLKIKDAIRNYQNNADRITMAKGGTQINPLSLDVTIRVNAYIDFDNPVNLTDDSKIDSIDTGYTKDAVWVTLDDDTYGICGSVVWYPIKTSTGNYFQWSVGMKKIVRALIDNHGLDIQTFGLSRTSDMLRGVVNGDTR